MHSRLPQYFTKVQDFIRDLKNFHETRDLNALPSRTIEKQSTKTKFSIISSIEGTEALDLFFTKLADKIDIDYLLNDNLTLDEIIQITDKLDHFMNEIKLSTGRIESLQRSLNKILEKNSISKKELVKN
jgi:hypothetical protein